MKKTFVVLLVVLLVLGVILSFFSMYQYEEKKAKCDKTCRALSGSYVDENGVPRSVFAGSYVRDGRCFCMVKEEQK